MLNFKFSIAQTVYTPSSQGRICDRFDTDPITYKVVMVNEHPVRILTFNEDRLVAIEVT